MLRMNHKVFSQMWLFSLLAICAAVLQGCNGCTPASNSNNGSAADVKVFSKGLSVLNLIKPPPTDGPGGLNLYVQVDKIKSELNVSSLKDVAIVLMPRRNSVDVESIEFAIYSSDGKEKIFSLQALPASNLRIFNPVERSGSDIAGYVFNLDPQKIAEADKYFISGNSVQLIPLIKRESIVNANFYLVDKKSEVTKKN